jgi:pimeloyl-ACP methyl ester carboxylesterase
MGASCEDAAAMTDPQEQRDVTEQRATVGGVEVRWRRAAPPAGVTPTLYVHGVPTSSADWLPFLARTGGVAVDLPGFGESAKPADFDYSIAGYDRFLEAFLDEAELDRFSLVVHDWGAAALATAQRLHGRLERLVLLGGCVPLLEGYEWHRLARIWRRPLAGELFMGFSTRWALKRLTKEATTVSGGLPQEMLDEIWRHFDHGTQRAILKLYRSAPPATLAAAGRELGSIASPALVLWPDADPYIDASFGGAYAAALGGPVKQETIAGAGHWPWVDRPETIDRVAAFLAG